MATISTEVFNFVTLRPGTLKHGQFCYSNLAGLIAKNAVKVMIRLDILVESESRKLF